MNPLAMLLPAVPDDRPADLTLLRVSRRAMATTFEVALPYGTPDGLEAAEDALDLIDELEEQLSIYRETSEVTRVNQLAASEAVPISDRLFDILEQSQVYSQQTRGAFDIAIGALIKAWGFHRRQGAVPAPADLNAARQCSGSRHLVLNAQQRTVRFRRAGLELNLGAIGKGYALDLVAQRLKQRWRIRSALLHGGGSSVLAIGCPPGQPRGWGIAVRHPWTETRTLGTVWLNDRAMGTSAATYQHFEYNGRKLGHVLDPRTGWPAETAASVTMVAASASMADAYSTAGFVQGSDEAISFTRSRLDLALLMLPHADDRTPTTVGLSSANYDPPADRATNPAYWTLDP